MVDANRLKESWARVVSYGDQVPLRFYGRLFVAHPEVRDLFPLSMAVQRDRLVTALGLVVSRADELEELTPFLQQLGREHRKFAAQPGHYGAIGEALLATLADFLDDIWTTELATDWAQAYRLVAEVMIEAAQAASAHSPPWWEAEIVAHERRSFDISVMVIRPNLPYVYVPGQSIPIESDRRPRVWRYYSPANAPRADHTIELHIRRALGGQVSSALVDQSQVGDVLRLGAPVGQVLVLQPPSGRDLLLLAGGTGLAPLKALVDQMAADPGNPGGPGPGPGPGSPGPGSDVRLFVGARTARELYDIDSLRVLERKHPWLTVIPAISDDTLHPHECGQVTDVALRLVPNPADHDIYVCGSDQMVAVALEQLRKAGCPPEQVHHESFLGLVEGASGGAVHLESEP